MEFRLEKLGPNTKKALEPACAVCRYEADWLLRIGEAGEPGTLERLFCDRDLRDALLDAINFSCAVPDVLGF